MSKYVDISYITSYYFDFVFLFSIATYLQNTLKWKMRSKYRTSVTKQIRLAELKAKATKYVIFNSKLIESYECDNTDYDNETESSFHDEAESSFDDETESLFERHINLQKKDSNYLDLNQDHNFSSDCSFGSSDIIDTNENNSATQNSEPIDYTSEKNDVEHNFNQPSNIGETLNCNNEQEKNINKINKGLFKLYKSTDIYGQ